MSACVCQRETEIETDRQTDKQAGRQSAIVLGQSCTGMPGFYFYGCYRSEIRSFTQQVIINECAMSGIGTRNRKIKWNIV